MESGESPRERTSQEQLATTQEIVTKLPTDLQSVIAGSMEGIAKAILAQQTSLNGDSAEVRATPEQVAFYARRFQEIASLGVLNPHLDSNSKKLIFSE